MAFEPVDPNVPSPTANSYIAVADFNSFHADRNVTEIVDAEYDTTQIQGALVQATDYIEKQWGRKFRGWKRSQSQRLEWPRIDAFDNDNYLFDPIPHQLVAATAEYALLALQLGRNLAPVPELEFATIDTATGEVSQGQGTVTKQRDKAGPLESETSYAQSTSTSQATGGNTLAQAMLRTPTYPQADMWLNELVTSRRTLRRGS